MKKSPSEAIGPISEEVGRAVQASQQMEFAIRFSITLMKQLDEGFFTNEEFESEISVFAKGTFGRLIAELKKKVNFDQKAEESLKDALTERNYIVHHFFNDQVENLISPEGRELSLKRLLDARAKMHAGYQILDNITSTLLELSGHSLDEVMACARAEYR